jgi:hypothetical protein
VNGQECVIVANDATVKVWIAQRHHLHGVSVLFLTRLFFFSFLNNLYREAPIIR